MELEEAGYNRSSHFGVGFWKRRVVRHLSPPPPPFSSAFTPVSFPFERF
jgi:hypothetical protein